MWKRSEIAFDLIHDDSDGSVVVVEVTVPGGRLMIMAEVEVSGGTLFARGFHMHAEGLAANEIGLANLRLIASVILERLDVDTLHIEGSTRTTGARPGRRPQPLRFARKPCPGAG